MTVVVAVIPTFRPDAGMLTSLVAALGDAGVPVVVADDASPCTSDPVLDRVETVGARVVRHASNEGIARGLNAGLQAAVQAGAHWLLTVDQDSTIHSEYVGAILAAADAAIAALGHHGVGALAAGVINDASGDLGYPMAVEHGLQTTAEVIQTGTMWSVEGLVAVGGFDESFGIDAVDAAACVRLRASGRRIVLVPGLAVGHQIGTGRQVALFGRTVMATGHSAERRTTIVRNRLRLAPEEFRQSPLQAWRSLRRVAVGTALAVTIEDDRWAKAKASARGVFRRGDR